MHISLALAFLAGERVERVSAVPRYQVGMEGCCEHGNLALVAEVVQQNQAAAPDLGVVVFERAAADKVERDLLSVPRSRGCGCRCGIAPAPRYADDPNR